MNERASIAAPGSRWVLSARTTGAFGLAFALFVAAGLVGLVEHVRASHAGILAFRTLEAVDGAQRVLVRLVEAESGQRGYLLTGDARYLEPYEEGTRSIPADLARLREVTAGDAAQEARVAALASLTASKLAELRAMVDHHRRGDPGTALAILTTHEGKATMDRIRGVIGEVRDHEDALLAARVSARHVHATWIGAIIALLSLAGAGLVAGSTLAMNGQVGRRLRAEREAARAEAGRAHAAAAAAAREELLRTADAANRAKEEFLAVLSHELRSPLTAMVGWLALLKRGGLTDAKRDHAFEVLERNLAAQTRLVEDVLDVSRIIAGKLAIEPEPLDLAALVRGVLDDAAPSAAKQGLEVVSSADVVLPGEVVGDERRLRQVVGNLLGNAMKFTPRGGRVTVTLTAEDGRACVEVRDTGQGIAPESLPHVFDRFVQADSSSARRHGGLGLGLAIVRSLVELHGGGVEARSDGPGRGATFRVSLPLRPIDRWREHGPVSAVVPRAQLAGTEVLLVDDDADSREVLAAALEREGARVHQCGCVAEALHVVDCVTLDAIVSDVGMPEEDGYGFARKLRRRCGFRGPLLALTGFASSADRQEAMRAGFDDYLTKPVGPDALVAKVRQMIGSKDGSAPAARWS